MKPSDAINLEVVQFAKAVKFCDATVCQAAMCENDFAKICKKVRK